MYTMFFRRIENHINNLYQKAKPTAERLFQKGREFAGNVSRISGQASDILGKVADIGSRILNSSEAREIAGLDPRLGKALAVGQRGVQYAGMGSDLSRQVSNFTNEGTYRGNHGENLQNALERAKQIGNDAQTVKYI